LTPTNNGQIPANPLTPDHLKQLNNALDAVKQAEYQIELATRAGIDVSNLKETNDANKTKLIMIKQTYFPGQ
jgi:hypothetical protein